MVFKISLGEGDLKPPKNPGLLKSVLYRLFKPVDPFLEEVSVAKLQNSAKKGICRKRYPLCAEFCSKTAESVSDLVYF